jgi:hypothetical protein
MSVRIFERFERFVLLSWMGEQKRIFGDIAAGQVRFSCRFKIFILNDWKISVLPIMFILVFDIIRIKSSIFNICTYILFHFDDFPGI